MKIHELGRLVRDRRRTLALDQRSLAEIAHVSVHCLSDLESGKGNPTFTVISQIATALGLEFRLDVRPIHSQDGES